eukprot:PhF_6_TR4381/c0_g1_i1/m.5911
MPEIGTLSPVWIVPAFRKHCREAFLVRYGNKVNSNFKNQARALVYSNIGLTLLTADGVVKRFAPYFDVTKVVVYPPVGLRKETLFVFSFRGQHDCAFIPEPHEYNDGDNHMEIATKLKVCVERYKSKCEIRICNADTWKQNSSLKKPADHKNAQTMLDLLRPELEALNVDLTSQQNRAVTKAGVSIEAAQQEYSSLEVRVPRITYPFSESTQCADIVEPGSILSFRVPWDDVAPVEGDELHEKAVENARRRAEENIQTIKIEAEKNSEVKASMTMEFHETFEDNTSRETTHPNVSQTSLFDIEELLNRPREAQTETENDVVNVFVFPPNDSILDPFHQHPFEFNAPSSFVDELCKVAAMTAHSNQGDSLTPQYIVRSHRGIQQIPFSFALSTQVFHSMGKVLAKHVPHDVTILLCKDKKMMIQPSITFWRCPERFIQCGKSAQNSHTLSDEFWKTFMNQWDRDQERFEIL